MCPIFQNEGKNTLDEKGGRRGERVRLGYALMHSGSEEKRRNVLKTSTQCTQCTQDKCLGRFLK